uniref:C-type lectin n=1 Tax=Thelotornis mossambicanus TaxID=1328036 RepID=A0A646QBS2_9SAUR
MGRFIFVTLGLLVVAFSLNGTGADHHCPSDWVSFQHFCYKLIEQRKTWADAETFCAQQQNGSHLASIQSRAESAYVARVASNKVFLTNVWIGLSDPKKIGTWQWSDGSSLGYTSWERREPKNRDDQESCVELSRRSGYLGWKSVNCESERFFICKLQPESVGST